MGRKKDKKLVQKPIKIFTLDTETRGLFGEVFRIGLYDGDQTIKTNNYKEIKETLDHYTIDYQCHIFIHNLDFDLAKLAKELVPGTKFSDSVIIGNNVAVFHSSNIILHDSLKLLPASLERLCKSFQLEEKAKVDLSDHLINKGYAVNDFDTVVTNKEEMNKRKSLGNYFKHVDPEEKELNDYLDSDLISLYEIIYQIKDISGLDWEEFISCPTTASLAMKVFKTNYEDDYKDITKTNWRGEWGEFCEKFVREGYYGGRTEVFKTTIENGYHYDVNSLYPYVMKVNEFPIGFYKFYNGEKAGWVYKHWFNSGLGGGFAEIDIYIPEDIHIPPLPVRIDKKLIFPVGNLTGVWTFQEIAMAVKYGAIIKKFKQVLHFPKTGKVFEAFVEDHEELKINSEGAKKEFAKLIQNSLYGKFGMKRLRKTLLDIEDEQDCKDKGFPSHRYNHPFLEQEFLIAEIKVNAQYIQPHIAAYVTSLARILLYEGLVNQIDTTYCDTDSMVCKNKMPDDVVHPDRYGAWDLESIVEKGIYIQPKLYFERSPAGKITVKAKGIPGDVLSQFNETTYDTIMEKILAGEHRIEIFGHAEISRNLVKGVFKTRKKFISMIKTELDMNILNEQMEEVHTSQVIRKGINLRAKQKRIMDYENNTSKPHRVVMF